MDDRPVLISIVVGLVLLAAIVGASLLFTPAHPPVGRESGATEGPSRETAQTQAPSGSPAPGARIEDVDTSGVRMDANSPVRIRIANTGQVPLSQERIEMKMGRDFFLIGYQERSYTATYTETIEPGASHTFTLYFNIPSHYAGVPLAGTYNAEAKLYVQDTFVDDWKGTVVLS